MSFCLLPAHPSISILPQVDLIVVGSVAVSEKGYRIGKGEGFADMEWGMMATMGSVRAETIVVTIVHDCQVGDKRRKDLCSRQEYTFFYWKKRFY